MTFLKNQRFILLLCLLPLLGSMVYLDRYAVTGLPLMDDFTYTTAFIFPFEQAQGLWEKWKVLFVQHFVTEHRIPTGKLFIYGLYLLGGGHLDLKVLAWSGNVCIPGVVALCGWVFRKTGRSLAYFLPVAWLVFQVQHFELFFWSNCSLLYVPVVFFALCATYFLVYHREHSRGRFGLAVLFTLLCMYSFGNGMFVFATNAALLAYQQRWRALALMGGLGAFCVVTYFIGYHSEYPTQLNALAVLNYLALLGAWVEPLNWFGDVRLGLSVGLGLVVTGVFGWFVGRLVLRKLREWRWLQPRWVPDVSREELFFTVSLLFLALTGAAVAVKRWSPDAGEMFTSRYRYIGVFFVAISYLLVVNALPATRRRLLAGATLGLAVFVHALSYVFYLPKLVNDREKLIVGAFNYGQHGSWHLFPMGGFWTNYIDTGTATALKTGLFRFPPEFYSGIEPQILTADTTRTVSLPLTPRAQPDGLLLVNDTFTPTPDSRPDEGTALLLRSERHGVFMVPVQRLANAGRKNLLRHGRVFGKGFAAFLPKNTYPPGVYRVGIVYRDAGQVDVRYTPQTVGL